jgi:NTP pyrophosphatase (non-canonical NTP hydrolase)
MLPKLRSKHEIIQAAVKTFGIEAQERMALEEMGELITALCKLHRKHNGNDLSAVASEIADVQLMLDQLIYMYNIEDKVQFAKLEKLDRLESLLWKGDYA